MKTTHKKIITLVTAMVLLTVGLVSLSGCTSQQQTNTIKISGAYSLYPMMVVWATAYHKNHTDLRIDVTTGGAGKGLSDAKGGKVDLGMVSFTLNATEAQGMNAVAVVTDAVLAEINSANPVLANITSTGLTRQQLTGIFIDHTITTWGELVGNPSITSPIKVYSRSDRCGAAETWVRYLNASFTQDSFPTAEWLTKVKGDDLMSKSISGDPLSIGYSNVNYIYSNTTMQPKTGLIPVPLDINGNGVLDATENFYGTRSNVVDAEISGALPSPPARLVYLVTLGNFTGLTKDFVHWILTDGQQLTIANGYAPLSSDLVAEQLQILGV